MLFGDGTEAAVLEGLARVRAQADAARIAALEKYHDFYESGEELKPYLVQFPGEEDSKFRRRAARIAAMNPVPLIANTIADTYYSGEVSRSWGAGAGAEKLLAEVLEYNEARILQDEIGLSQVVLGEGWVRVQWDEEDETVAIHAGHAGNLNYTLDPRNPRRLLEVIERRYLGGRTVWQDHVWTPEFSCIVDQANKFVQPIEPNEYGTVPFAIWRGRAIAGELRGQSLIAGAVTLADLILQQASDLDWLLIHSAHKIVWSRGIEQPQVTDGVDRWIHFTGGREDGGEIGAVDQSGDIEGFLKVIQANFDAAFQLHGVPVAVIKGEEAASGFALKVRYAPLSGVASGLRLRAVPPERRVLRLVAIIGNAHGRGYPSPEKLKPEVRFETAIVPSDGEAEKMADQREVEKGLLTRDSYLRRHHPELDTDEKRKAYAAELDAEAAARRATKLPRSPSILGPESFGAGVGL